MVVASVVRSVEHSLDLTSRLILKLARRDDVSPDEQQALASLPERTESYEAGATIIREGVPQIASRLLLSGYSARRSVLHSGKQQITELHIPGDFVDLHSFGLKVLDHDVVAITACEFAVVPHERLERITETMPHLTRLLWLNTLLDAATHREWLVSAGRRTAYQHHAHLFCEWAVRHDVVGLEREGRYPFPFTQVQLADILGLTDVHVNRTLQEMRAAGLVDVVRRELVIHDFAGLAAAADFDPAYLHLDRRRR